MAMGLAAHDDSSEATQETGPGAPASDSLVADLLLRSHIARGRA